MREMNQGRGRARGRGVLCLLLAVAAVAVLGSPGVRAYGELPDTLSITAGSNAVLDIKLPGSVLLDAGDNQATLRRGDGAL